MGSRVVVVLARTEDAARLRALGTPAGESVVLGSEPVAPGVGYRITARAVGARPETVVVLQSIYATR